MAVSRANFERITSWKDLLITSELRPAEGDVAEYRNEAPSEEMRGAKAMSAEAEPATPEQRANMMATVVYLRFIVLQCPNL